MHTFAALQKRRCIKHQRCWMILITFQQFLQNKIARFCQKFENSARLFYRPQQTLMLQNTYFIFKIGADSAENEPNFRQKFAKFCQKQNVANV